MRAFRQIRPTTTEPERILGEPGVDPCRHCGAEIPRLLIPYGSSVAGWERGPHDCAEGRAAAAREGERREAARLEGLRNPSPERIAALRRAGRLPCFAPSGLERLEPRPGQQAAYRALQRHREAWSAGQRPEKGIWLVGPTGGGKSTLIGALLFDVLNHGHQGLFWNVPELFEEMKFSYRKQRTRYDPQAILDARILVLDEIPPDHVTPWSVYELYCLVNAPYASCGELAPRQTIYVTSNVRPSQVAEHLATEEDPDRGDRIARRLVEMTEQIEVRR